MDESEKYNVDIGPNHINLLPGLQAKFNEKREVARIEAMKSTPLNIEYQEALRYKVLSRMCPEYLMKPKNLATEEVKVNLEEEKEEQEVRPMLKRQQKFSHLKISQNNDLKAEIEESKRLKTEENKKKRIILPSRPVSKLIKGHKKSCLTSKGTEEDEVLSKESTGTVKNMKTKKQVSY